MSETTKVDLAELRRLAEAATPTEGATLNRYEHGGGRLFIDRTQERGGRQLIADFYGDGADREFYAAASPATILALLTRLEEAEAENARLREALTPSAATKAAYIGEFSFDIVSGMNCHGEEPEEIYRSVMVPWTTIKEIMAAIRARALTSNPVQGD
jgi:hypothetical protein